MAYRIVKNAAVWWPMRWSDVEEGGAVVEREIEFKFRRFRKEELVALDIGALDNPDLVLKLAVDWRGAEDGDGKPLPFTRDGLAEFFDQPGLLGDALLSSWRSCMRGEPERRLGNSKPSPADGAATATDLSPDGAVSASS